MQTIDQFAAAMFLKYYRTDLTCPVLPLSFPDKQTLDNREAELRRDSVKQDARVSRVLGWVDGLDSKSDSSG